MKLAALSLAVLALCAACGGAAEKTGARAAKDPTLAKAELYIRHTCGRTASVRADFWGDSQYSLYNALYGNCKAGDGTDQHVWFFRRGRFIGSDTPAPWNGSRRILPVWRDNVLFAFMYVTYRPMDPECCSTGGGKIVRFRLHGDEVKRLDPFPRGR
jgi:hypothetical protein